MLTLLLLPTLRRCPAVTVPMMVTVSVTTLQRPPSPRHLLDLRAVPTCCCNGRGRRLCSYLQAALGGPTDAASAHAVWQRC